MALRPVLVPLVATLFLAPLPAVAEFSPPPEATSAAPRKGLFSKLKARKAAAGRPLARPVDPAEIRGERPASPAAVVPVVPIPPGWSFRAEFSDEFDGARVDPSRWETNPGSWGAWSWDPRLASTQGGRLILSMVHEPHRRKESEIFHKAGIVRSHGEISLGYFEARIKGCPLFPGASPAFWLYSLGSHPGREIYSEIDIVELQQDSGAVKRPAMMDFNLHARVRGADGGEVTLGPGSHPGICAHRWRAPFDPRRDFHVYSAMVTNQRIAWFVDGREVASEANLNWHLPMRLVLSLGLRAPYMKEEGGEKRPVPERSRGRGFPTAMEVDYVRVWAPPVRRTVTDRPRR